MTQARVICRGVREFLLTSTRHLFSNQYEQSNITIKSLNREVNLNSISYSTTNGISEFVRALVRTAYCPQQSTYFETSTPPALKEMEHRRVEKPQCGEILLSSVVKKRKKKMNKHKLKKRRKKATL